MATIKTLKLKPAPASPPMAPPPVEAPATPQQAPAGLDHEAGAIAGKVQQSRKLLMWLTLAVVCFAATILVLQYVEFSFYAEPPSVWPVK